MIKIAPSIFTADSCYLGEAIKMCQDANADMLHVDVMDGVFVPNIALGIHEVACMRKFTDMILDVHLMMIKPQLYIPRFAEAGADIIGIHFEADCEPLDVLKQIRSLGKKSCLTIKPATAFEEIFNLLPHCDMILVMSVEPGYGGQKFIPESLDKIRKLKQFIESENLTCDIEVDGGVNAENAVLLAEAGADVLVMGSSLFGETPMKTIIAKLHETL